MLHEAYRGDTAAAERFWAMVYEKLHTMARRELQGRRHYHTLTATSLVHECYLKLMSQTHIVWQDRRHFFAIACKAMRGIIVDRARRRNAQKRWRQDVPLEESVLAVEARSADLVALDEALTRLSVYDNELAQIVEYRYFGGLTMKEIAEALGLSMARVERRWRVARVWLWQELRRN